MSASDALAGPFAALSPNRARENCSSTSESGLQVGAHLRQRFGKAEEILGAKKEAAPDALFHVSLSAPAVLAAPVCCLAQAFAAAVGSPAAATSSNVDTVILADEKRHERRGRVTRAAGRSAR
jgi:hypothetical protein